MAAVTKPPSAQGFTDHCRALVQNFNTSEKHQACSMSCGSFPEDLARELVHALMLMPLMIIDLRLPTSGTVVATDASEYGQGVCRAVGLTAAGKLEAKRLETQRAQRWDNRIGLVDTLAGLSSWRALLLEGGRRQTE